MPEDRATHDSMLVAISRLPALTSLHLSRLVYGFGLTDVCLAALADMPQLRSLVLFPGVCARQISLRGLVSLARSRSLTDLNIRTLRISEPLTDAVVAQLCECHSLQALAFDAEKTSSMSSACFMPLVQLPNLQSVLVFIQGPLVEQITFAVAVLGVASRCRALRCLTILCGTRAVSEGFVGTAEFLAIRQSPVQLTLKFWME
jgi:hypothetical protein